MEKHQQQQQQQQQSHILVAAYPAQGHINPALRLAKRIARQTAARITFSTAVIAHRSMFPNQETEILDDDNLFAYTPYSNGYEDRFDRKPPDENYISYTQQQSSASLAAILDDQAARGRPVTCLIYSFLMSWAADIARERGIPSFLFWIQPATAFAAYWHYFHHHESIVSADHRDPSSVVNLPHLPPMRICDLPSFITEDYSSDDIYATIFVEIRKMFTTLDAEISLRGSKAKVIANTADEMEAAAILSVAEKVSIVGVGPLLDVETAEGSMIKIDEKNAYMDWLDKQDERSVVYVSFGSLLMLKKGEVEKIRRGLRESGRPYLWVIRKDNRFEGVDDVEEDKKGMIVEWCSQERVLKHRAVGCFVTHCGWNSTVESLLSGVPTVAVPQWTDQRTSAWLIENAWGTGVRVEASKDGLVEAEELKHCLEIVMGEGEKSKEIRGKVEIWKNNACNATIEGGSSYDNLQSFVKEIEG